MQNLVYKRWEATCRRSEGKKARAKRTRRMATGTSSRRRGGGGRGGKMSGSTIRDAVRKKSSMNDSAVKYPVFTGPDRDLKCLSATVAFLPLSSIASQRKVIQSPSPRVSNRPLHCPGTLRRGSYGGREERLGKRCLAEASVKG